MKCPRCHGRDLWIYIHFSGYVLCESDFTDEIAIRETTSMNSDFDEESPCRCDACGWTGSVVDANEREPVVVASRSTSRYPTRSAPVESTVEVKRRLAEQPCPVVWGECIRYLMKRMEAQEKLLQDQKKQIRKLKTHSGPESQDTTIM